MTETETDEFDLQFGAVVVLTLIGIAGIVVGYEWMMYYFQPFVSGFGGFAATLGGASTDQAQEIGSIRRPKPAVWKKYVFWVGIVSVTLATVAIRTDPINFIRGQDHGNGN